MRLIMVLIVIYLIWNYHRQPDSVTQLQTLGVGNDLIWDQILRKLHSLELIGNQVGTGRASDQAYELVMDLRLQVLNLFHSLLFTIDSRIQTQRWFQRRQTEFYHLVEHRVQKIVHDLRRFQRNRGWNINTKPIHDGQVGDDLARNAHDRW